MTHHLLYWLGISWWSLGLARAQLLHVSKTCLLHLSCSKGSSAHSVAHPWLLMAWATFWILILYGPLPLRARLCLIVGFFSFSLPFCSFMQSCYHFLPYHSAIPTVMLFDHSLLGLFGPAVYSSLNDSIWSFVLLYYIACGLFCPIYFVLGILGPFAFLRLPWSFF